MGNIIVNPGAIDKLQTDTATNATNIGDLASLTTTEKTSLVAAANELNSKILYGNSIPSGITDFNNLIAPGRYQLAASGLSNAPANNIYGYVDVVKYGANFIGQNVYSYTSSGMILYARRQSNGTWGSWDSFALKSDLDKMQGNGSAASSVRCLGVAAPGGGYYIPLVSARTVSVTAVKAYSPSDYAWHSLTIDSVDSASNGIQRNIHCSGTVAGINAGMGVLVEVTATFS